MIPSTLKVTLSKYMKRMEPHDPSSGDIIIDYDVYNYEDPSYPPWYVISDKINTIIINEGVENVSILANPKL